MRAWGLLVVVRQGTLQASASRCWSPAGSRGIGRPSAWDGFASLLKPRSPPKELWAIARVRKRQSAQSAETNLARQWPTRPEVPFCQKGDTKMPVGGPLSRQSSAKVQRYVTDHRHAAITGSYYQLLPASPPRDSNSVPLGEAAWAVTAGPHASVGSHCRGTHTPGTLTWPCSFR